MVARVMQTMTGVMLQLDSENSNGKIAPTITGKEGIGLPQTTNAHTPEGDGDDPRKLVD